MDDYMFQKLEVASTYAIRADVVELGARLDAHDRILPQLTAFRLCTRLGHGRISSLPIEIRLMIEKALRDPEEELRTWRHELDCFKGTANRQDNFDHLLAHSDALYEVVRFASDSCPRCVRRACRKLGLTIIPPGLAPADCSCRGFEAWFTAQRRSRIKEECCETAEEWEACFRNDSAFRSDTLKRFGLKTWTKITRDSRTDDRRITAYLIPYEVRPAVAIDFEHEHRDQRNEIAVRQDLVDISVFNERLKNLMRALDLPLFEPGSRRVFTKPDDVMAVFMQLARSLNH